MAHGDFYFTINATFYHFSERWGEQALIEYWKTLGSEYLRPLARQFETGGLDEIARYYRAYYDAEPGSEVDISRADNTLIIDVKVCPVFRWFKESPVAHVHPPLHPMYCQHCRYTAEAMLQNTPFEFELRGGQGTCQQIFRLRG